MIPELSLVVWSTVLVLTYVCVQAVLYRLDYGIVHGAGPRDNERPPRIFAARAEKALRNLLETYALFVALALVTEVTGRSDGLTLLGSQLYFWARWVYLPLYIFGVPYVRSAVRLVSALGLVLMFFGVAF